MSCANGARLPSASLRSWPRPSSDWAWVWIQFWKAARVLGSNARRISSSSTVSATCPVARRPLSGTLRAFGLPGVSST